MISELNEKSLSKLINFGAAIVTVLVVSGSVTDPVNTPKFLALGIVAAASIGGLYSLKIQSRLRESKILVSIILAFCLFAILSTIASNSPISQNFYGAYGRNNGALTYLFLSLIMIAVLTFRSKSSFRGTLDALFWAGVINIIYCTWVVFFGDFVGWSNPYGNILGTLGNPNFIGSFLGFFFSVSLVKGIDGGFSSKIGKSQIVILPLTAFLIYKSHAIQGIVVAAVGVSVIGFFYIRKFNKNYLLWGYSSAVIFLGAISALGALQIGPFTSIIYKTSVSLRGIYWNAGWNVGSDHPLLGIGMDSFGDWYRRGRSEIALELPGINTVTNASHNVPIDIFAFGGWPLFSAYILIMIFAVVAILKMITRGHFFDPILAGLSASWVGYQIQSIISINQIGLAIWGWILSGSLIAYEKSTSLSAEGKVENNRGPERKKTASSQSSSFVIAATFSGVVGLLVALPPLSSDVKWRSAQVARSAQAVEESMIYSYFNPQNSNKYLLNIQALEESGLFEISHKYAVKATEWNKDSFELWKMLYLLRKSTESEKVIAVKNMQRLDPLNPDVTAVQ